MELELINFELKFPTNYFYPQMLHRICLVHLYGLTGSALDHRWLPPEFESRRGHIWRVFHLWLRFFTFGGCSAHLSYHVQISGHKTSIIIIIIIIIHQICHLAQIFIYLQLYLLLLRRQLCKIIVILIIS